MPELYAVRVDYPGLMTRFVRNGAFKWDRTEPVDLDTSGYGWDSADRAAKFGNLHAARKVAAAFREAVGGRYGFTVCRAKVVTAVEWEPV